jgi:hypothetical protein
MSSLPSIDAALVFSVIPHAITWVGLLSALMLLYRERTCGAPLAILCLAISLFSVSLVSGPQARYILIAAGLLALLKVRHELPDISTLPAKPLRVLTVAALSIFSATLGLLLYNLDSYSYKPLVWEAVVIKGLVIELNEHLPMARRIYSRLLWSEGLLSEGNRSLVYGFATSELLGTFPSMFTTRIVSVTCTAIGLGALYGMMRMLFSPSIAVIALAVCGLNELVLIFGRYGSSIAGTFSALIVAFWACSALVLRPRFALAIGAALALFITTLGYAPARLMVMMLAPLTTVGVLLCATTEMRKRALVAATFCLCIAGITYWQSTYGRVDMFTSARLEHIPGMFITGYWPDFLQSKWQALQNPYRIFSLSDYITFSKQIITNLTWPNLVTLTSPFLPEARSPLAFEADPMFLRLYSSLLFPFLLIGMVTMRRFQRRWLGATLWLCTAWTIVILLLTNRIDSYRAVFLILPFTIWTSVGLYQFCEILCRNAFGNMVVFISCFAVLSATIATRIHDLGRPADERLITKTVALPLLAKLPPNSIIGLEPADFRILAELSLDTQDRLNTSQRTAKRFLSPEEYGGLHSAELRTMDRFSRELPLGGALVLGPARSFIAAAAEFNRQGFKTLLLETPQMNLFIIVSAPYANEVQIGTELEGAKLESLAGWRQL